MPKPTDEKHVTFWEQMRQAWRDGYAGQAPRAPVGEVERPQRHRQVGALLHELAPRSQVETMLAQRVISARVRLREAEATVEGLRKMQRGDQLTQNIAKQSGIDVDTVAYAHGQATIAPAMKDVLSAERALVSALHDLRQEQDRRVGKKKR